SVLGDGASIHTAGAGEADLAARELFARELVGTGADRLDKAEARRAVEEGVVPQTGNHQHVGVGDAGRERFGSAHREAPAAAPERRKALVEPEADMRDTEDGLELG